MANIFNRNDLFKWYQLDFPGAPISIIELAFKCMTDIELAKCYGLKILRKGYFYR